MTDVLIDSMTYAVETQDVDWWAEDDPSEAMSGEPYQAKPDSAKLRWLAHQTGMKTYAEADAFARKLHEVYRKVRITKTVKYVEAVLGEDPNV